MKKNSGTERVSAYSERMKSAGYKRICAYVSTDTEKLIQSYVDMGFNKGEAIDEIALDSVKNNPRFGLMKIIDIKIGVNPIHFLKSKVKIDSNIYEYLINGNGDRVHNLDFGFGKNPDLVENYNGSLHDFYRDYDELRLFLNTFFYEYHGYWPKKGVDQ